MSPSVAEAIGRARKVERITLAIDTELLAHDMSPFSPEVLDKLLSRLREMSPDAWAQLCGKHGVRAPSATTTAAVIAYFAERRRHVDAVKRPPVPDVA